jgi:hypothetical protein
MTQSSWKCKEIIKMTKQKWIKIYRYIYQYAIAKTVPNTSKWWQKEYQSDVIAQVKLSISLKG